MYLIVCHFYMKQLWISTSKGPLGTYEETAFYQREGGFERATEPKRFHGREEIGAPDVITTCLLFVRMVLCESCNIRIIRGMHAASRNAGG